MKILLFLLGISFFFIFFLFSTLQNTYKPIIETLYIEAHIYIIFVLFFIIRVWKSDSFKKKKLREHKIAISVSWSDLFGFLRLFFGKYIYYIACLLFYISLFFLLKVLFGEIDIPKMLFSINLLILGFYFFEHKFELFQDFVRVNTSLVSLYYIGFQIPYLLGIGKEMVFIDGVNIIILFILFFLLLRVSQKRGKKYIPTISSYIVIFSFLEYSVILKHFFGSLDIGLSVLSFLGSILFLLFTQKIHQKIHISQELIRVWGLVSSYIFLYISTFIVIPPSFFQVLYIPAMLFVSTILLDFHKKFQNYISFTLASCFFIIITYALYLSFTPEVLEKHFLFGFFFLSSLLFFILEKVYQPKYVYDVYFFRIFSLIVNISGVISFFLFWDFSILHTAIILLGESLYLFFSYYTLRNISQKG